LYDVIEHNNKSSQQPTIAPYPELALLSFHPHNLYPKDLLWYYPPIYALIS
jgi:hypothetical protein